MYDPALRTVVTATIRTDLERPTERARSLAQDVPPAVASDAMERLGAMEGAIGPVSRDAELVGAAVTVDCMVGDNLLAHKAIELAEPGDVLVIDAGAHEDTAVWGDIMTYAAAQRGLAGVVIDGAIRDVSEARERHFPVFCRETVPAGPHKGWGGRINTSVQCGGVSVSPGDLVLGDDDGVVVVPRERAEAILETARDRLDEEEEWRTAIESGDSTIEAIGLDKTFDALDVQYLNGNDST